MKTKTGTTAGTSPETQRSADRAAVARRGPIGQVHYARVPRPDERVADVLFSPSYGQLEGRELADWILQDRLQVRMQLQMHKLLWNDEPGH